MLEACRGGRSTIVPADIRWRFLFWRVGQSSLGGSILGAFLQAGCLVLFGEGILDHASS